MFFASLIHCKGLKSVLLLLMLTLILGQNPTEITDNMELFSAQFVDVEIIFLLYTLDFTVMFFISLLAKRYRLGIDIDIAIDTDI